MAYTVNSQVEFDQNYSGTLTFGESTQSVYSAFSNNTTIVTVTIAPTLSALSVINAGSYADLILTSTSLSLGTAFDLGYGTNGGNGYYTSAANTLSTTTVGPSNTSAGYGTLEIGGGLISAGVADGVNFAGTNNTLILDTSTLPSGGLLSSINNFQGNGDQIVFNGVTAANAKIVSYSNGLLTFSNNGVTATVGFTGMAGTVTASNFTIGNTALVEGGNSSTHAGNLVIGFATCFLRGTMIATPSGEVAVETLRAGDLVTAVEAGQTVSRPVSWVGGPRQGGAPPDGAAPGGPRPWPGGAPASRRRVRPEPPNAIRWERCDTNGSSVAPALVQGAWTGPVGCRCRRPHGHLVIDIGATKANCGT